MEKEVIKTKENMISDAAEKKNIVINIKNRY